MSNLFSIRFRDPANPETSSQDGSFGRASGDYFAGPENALLQALTEDLQEPDQRYNPVFIYGPTGLGKTHLMHGLVEMYRVTHPNALTYSIGGADFARSIATAIDVNSTDDVRETYRTKDLFALDDLQEIANKPHAQHELLHTLDTLLEQQAVVLMASRVAPAELPLIDGLKSRVIQGLTIPLQAPCPETARWVVQHFAEEFELKLTPDAVNAVASNGGKHRPRLIPELRGLMLQIREAELSPNESITSVRIARLLDKQHHIPATAPRPIIQRTARHFALRIDDLTGPSRRQTTVLARGIAVYLIRQVTAASFQQIGRMLGNRDHTTVLHAYRRIEANLADPLIQTALREISARLGVTDVVTLDVLPSATTSKLARNQRADRKWE